MKNIMLVISILICGIITTSCSPYGGKKDFVPPDISAEVEILEVNGHELTLKVRKSDTDYCKEGDVIKGELKEFDYHYNKYQFKVGDIMNVWSEYDSVTETEIKFDRIFP